MTGDPHDSESSEEAFAALLDRHRDALVAHLERTAGGLARWESAEDLAQLVHMRALAVRERFEWQGEVALRRWLEAIARQVVSDRAAWWKARKRDAGHMLRVTAAGPVTGAVARGVDPRDGRTGPVTFTMRKDSLRRATLALSTLSERDQEILGLLRDGRSSEEIAERIELELASTQRAIHRARSRFEQAFALLEQA